MATGSPNRSHSASGRGIHLRGLFYRIVAAGDVGVPTGQPFINDLDCWKWLQDTAAKAARWLGYVPFERIIDNRNDPPLAISYAETPQPGSVGLTAGPAAPIECARSPVAELWSARGRSRSSRTASS